MEDPSTSVRRSAALKLLRDKKSRASPGSESNASNGSSSVVKDRVTSRHFPPSQASSSSPAKILVHDSSPAGKSSALPATTTASTSKYRPHQGHGVALGKPPSLTKSWNQREDDLLTPSNFTSSNHTSSSSISSITSIATHNLAPPRRKVSVNDAVDERPKKRVNTGTSTPVETIMIDSSPPPVASSSKGTPVRPSASLTTSYDDNSPEVVRTRKKFASARLASSLPASDEDEDEDLPDWKEVARPKKKGRLVRGRRTESEEEPEIVLIPSSPSVPPPPPNVMTFDPDTIQRLQLFAPHAQVEHILIILQEEQGNLTRTTNRLREELNEHRRREQERKATIPSLDPSFRMPVPNAARPRPPQPSKASGPAFSPISPIPGTQFNKGNHKSAIYANRPVASQVASGSRSAGPSKPSARDGRHHARRVESDEDDAMETDSSGGGKKGKAKKKSQWSDESSEDDDEDEAYLMRQAEGVSFFDTATMEQLIEVTACPQTAAASIVALRPFEDHADLRTKFNKRKGISYKLFEVYLSVMEGYSSLDKLLVKCEGYGKSIAKVVNNWAGIDSSSKAPSAVPTREPSVDRDLKPPTAPASGLTADAGIHLTQAAVPDAVDDDDPDLKDYIRSQPSLIEAGVQLKDYQMLGINWLNLLWSRDYSAILADEMGLGKTIQVIAFMAHLKETYPDERYRHLIIVPPSTLENWVREFQRFAPSIDVQTYYGTQNERVDLRYQLQDSEWDVVLTTYNFAAGNEHDRKFFKKMNWEVCVFDEGHMLKNFQSQRYEALMKIQAKWRLLLTGTPLQNNLQELVSLLNFIMPKLFIKHEESLRAIFKAKADSSLSFLSRERVSRAKKMMTPFVLRRRKDQVLKDLPQKRERIEWCGMSPLQKTIYREALQRSRKTIIEEAEGSTNAEASTAKPAPKKQPAKRVQKSKTGKVNAGDTSSNVLMDLRKAASHPMLFRRMFPAEKIRLMARSCLKEPEFCESNYEYVIEDMEVMTDAELQSFCKRYKSVNKFALDEKCYLDAGKIEVLLQLLETYKTEDKRVLIFSQFTQVLDIIKAIFAHLKIKYLILTGTTAVDERQGLVDEFNEDESIPVFLLSTKAGGMGINLTAACVVIIFDQDFNPHNDKQAMDRCYRIGQKRDVEVVKLLTKGTIEEDIHRIGTTKLMLDDAVAGGQEDEGERAEKIMKSSLLNVLRTKLEKEEEEEVNNNAVTDTVGNEDIKIVDGPSTTASTTAEGSPSIPIVIDDDDDEGTVGETDVKHAAATSEPVKAY